jgi:hypothetical protein
MVRVILGVIAGFFAWVIVWFGSETILSTVWPEFGTHQAAFQNAIEDGGPFTANSTILFVHIVLALFVSLVSGFIAALVSGETKRAPLFFGFLLLAMGFLKAAMSWPLVPVWYHVIFTVVLLPMTIIGGKLRSTLK